MIDPCEPVETPGGADAPAVDAAAWFAIWTRSHSEQLVSNQLEGKGFEVFLPKAAVWSVRRGVKVQNLVPLFPGYLFVRHAMDKHSHVQIISARGVVRVLGERWDRLETVADDVISGIQRITQSGETVMHHPLLRAGARFRVTAGPLQGLCGTFVRERSTKGLLVLTVDLLQRSVAVEVDSALVEAV